MRFDDEVPGTPLQALRLARGWSQARLGVELKCVAARRGRRLQVTEHLISTISRWENGHRRPSSFYLCLLLEVYDVDEAALSGRHPPDACLVRRQPDLASAHGGPEPWELTQALQASALDAATLAQLESSVSRLDRSYSALAPDAALSSIGAHLGTVLDLLGRSQPLDFRRRLCSLAGHLAGLRAWAAFDLDDHGVASAWYDAGLQPAREAGHDALCGWLLGAKSLVASYAGDHLSALRSIRRGQVFAARAAEPTALVWVTVLEARAHAGLGQERSSHLAQERAERWATDSSSDSRRHGMDFESGRISLRYGEGVRLVLLRQPEQAQHALTGALGVGGPQRLKHRSIVRLSLATALVQQGEPEAAVGTVRKALAIPRDQLIAPILQRARDVMAQLQPWHRELFARDLAEHLSALR